MRSPVPSVSGYMNRCSSSTRPSASIARTSVMLPLTYRSPSASSFSRRMAAGSYGPMTVELFQVGSVSVPDTTYFAVSLKNGAPGSSSAVRVDQAGSNISYVVRPSRIPLDRAVAAPIASPICGSKPESKVQVGASTMPSAVMNSCTWISPMGSLRSGVGGVRCRPARRRGLIAAGRRRPSSERPGRAHALDRRAVRVRDAGVVGLLLDRVPVLRGRRLDGVEDRRARRARAVHEDRARPVAGADRDVARAGRRVQVVPRPHPPLLALDDRDALARQDEEPLEVVLLVVEAGRVAGPQDVHADAEPVRLVVGRAEAAPRAAAGHRRPADLGQVEDVPAVVDRHAADVGLFDLRLVSHGA